MIRIETDRLIVRDHVPADLASHHALMSNDRVMRYLRDIQTHSLEASRQNMQSAIDEIGNPDRTRYFFRIEDKNGAHIGEIGYTVHAFTPLGKLVEVGYFTHEACWGQGYVTEAMQGLMRFAFLENDVYRIGCGCVAENIGSERVMQKCGLIFEGRLVQNTWLEGRLMDRVAYRLLRPEWLAAQAH